MIEITNKVGFDTELTKNILYTYYMRLYDKVANNQVKEQAEKTVKCILGEVRRTKTKIDCSLEVRLKEDKFYFYSSQTLVAVTYVKNYVDTLNTLLMVLTSEKKSGYKSNKMGKVCIKE